ncbi:hypothetical protein BpHYR1_035720 [Brachionus plicatilis]|uniref:Uncharacterized protein n=1 Tax=Brachionus plicatilis TaxID=10195 RepID=A0A3M7Q068_BRAPC|nr:hypothetical protein BpHYR1_035720 [Brachionus plicatilis]
MVTFNHTDFRSLVRHSINVKTMQLWTCATKKLNLFSLLNYRIKSHVNKFFDLRVEFRFGSRCRTSRLGDHRVLVLLAMLEVTREQFLESLLQPIDLSKYQDR